MTRERGERIACSVPTARRGAAARVWKELPRAYGPLILGRRGKIGNGFLGAAGPVGARPVPATGRKGYSIGSDRFCTAARRVDRLHGS